MIKKLEECTNTENKLSKANLCGGESEIIPVQELAKNKNINCYVYRCDHCFRKYSVLHYDAVINFDPHHGIQYLSLHL